MTCILHMDIWNVTCWSEFQVRHSLYSTCFYKPRHRGDMSNAFAKDGQGKSSHWRNIAHRSRTMGVVKFLLPFLYLGLHARYGFSMTSCDRFVAHEWRRFDPQDKSYRKSFNELTLNAVWATRHLENFECLCNYTLSTRGTEAPYQLPWLLYLHSRLLGLPYLK